MTMGFVHTPVGTVLGGRQEQEVKQLLVTGNPLRALLPPTVHLLLLVL